MNKKTRIPYIENVKTKFYIGTNYLDIHKIWFYIFFQELNDTITDIYLYGIIYVCGYN